jgi:hypothetical protein
MIVRVAQPNAPRVIDSSPDANIAPGLHSSRALKAHFPPHHAARHGERTNLPGADGRRLRVGRQRRPRT